MKKLAILFAVCSLTLVSCDLELYPDNLEIQDTALETLDDLEKFERGTYSAFRAMFNSQLIIAGDLQADYANAVMNFSNTYGPLHSWTYNYNDYEVADVWNAIYYAIANTNWVLYKKDVVEATLETEDDILLFDKIIGEMYFIRAFGHFLAVEKFAGAYDEATIDEPFSGVPVIQAYNPTELPSRKTLRESYQAILDDIALAEELLASTPGVTSSTKISYDAVLALKARVALQMKDYDTAYAAATELINLGVYELADTTEELKNIFTYDTGSEIILVPYASVTELAGIGGDSFILDVNSADDYFRPDYIPTKAQVDLYADNDIRKEAYFLALGDGKVEIGSSKLQSVVYLMNKYPGNPNLQKVAGTKNYANAVKVFRIAEMYLIAAEAGVNGAGDGMTYLNALRQARGLDALSIVSMSDVKEERRREMMFEGNRISDLKRWGDAMTGRTPQTGTSTDGSAAVLHNDGDNYNNLTVSAGDFRFVWPIPANEIYANQNLASQQNPGWIN